jgi:hypothetical protein
MVELQPADKVLRDMFDIPYKRMLALFLGQLPPIQSHSSEDVIGLPTGITLPHIDPSCTQSSYVLMFDVDISVQCYPHT